MLPFAPSSRRLGTVIARWALALFSIHAASCFSADAPNYYVTPRGYGLIPESEPPRYVH